MIEVVGETALNKSLKKALPGCGGSCLHPAVSGEEKLLREEVVTYLARVYEVASQCTNTAHSQCSAAALWMSPFQLAEAEGKGRVPPGLDRLQETSTLHHALLSCLVAATSALCSHSLTPTPLFLSIRAGPLFHTLLLLLMLLQGHVPMITGGFPKGTPALQMAALEKLQHQPST
ncbi:hypothetical protein O3P69_009554 [Scylla paramamosain]|uniref:Uncharacterized protein n=1 Tax=Scylla paramamosain TaxID=85552 RepID=A0AAW0SVG8_SCYPA